MAIKILIILIMLLMPVVSYGDVCFSDVEADYIEETDANYEACKEDLIKYKPAQRELEEVKVQLEQCQDRSFFTNMGWMGGTLATVILVILFI